MAKEVKLALVGTGGISGAHINNLKKLGGNRVVAVCDISDENRAKAADATGGKPYADMNQMFTAEPGIDAVLSFTPPTVRKQVVEAATARKLPVFVEKPPAFTAGDADQITAIAQKTGVPVSVGFMYRYIPSVVRLRELIAGWPVNQVISEFYCPGVTKWKLPGWFYIKEKSGGHIVDQAVHVMDLIRFLVGDITRVYTVGTNQVRAKADDFTIEDSSSTTMHFASGASGTHAHSWGHDQFKGWLTLVGQTFRLTLHYDNHLSGYVGDATIDETFGPAPDGAGHHYWEMQVFLDAVRSGDFSGIRSPYADAAKSLKTVLAMNRSIESGQPEAV